MDDNPAAFAWQFVRYAYYEDCMVEVWHNYVTGEFKEVRV
jgi:hypothetical protein